MASAQVATGIGELFVFGELLKQGLAIYKPLIYEGMDALVRLPNGQVLDLEIKSADETGSKGPRWFPMLSAEPRPDYFIVCVTFVESDPDKDPGPESGKNSGHGITNDVAEVWVFPSMVFYAYAGKNKPRGLDLDWGTRKYGEPLWDYLRGFLNRWELICDYEQYRRFMTSPEGFEDLEDILAMKEALESPEDEKMSYEEHVLKYPDTL